MQTVPYHYCSVIIDLNSSYYCISLSSIRIRERKLLVGKICVTNSYNKLHLVKNLKVFHSSSSILQDFYETQEFV